MPFIRTNKSNKERIMNEAELLEKYKLKKLSGADLTDCNLSGCYLPRANLYGVYLCGANLSGADLHEANLSLAILTGVDLHEANLSGAYLSGALLFGVDLCKSNLSGADLSGVRLCKAFLYGVDLRGADLSRADLSRAYLRGADLTDCNLSGAYLSGAILSEAILSGANLSEADLSGANLSGVNLSGVTGLASMEEEMRMLVLLREQTREEAFEFDMGDWDGEDEAGEIFPDESSFESLLNTCGTTHCVAGFCQVELARRKNPLALISAGVAGSYAIPSMARYFASSKEKFIEYLDDFISGKKPLLQR